MTKRLISVVALAVLLLLLASAATNARAANFGQIEKPGWGAAINATTVARYGTGGFSPARNVAALRRIGPVGMRAPESKLLASGTLTNSCANTPYRFFNAQLIDNLGFPIGITYKNTTTLTDTAYAAYWYTPTVGNAPAVYSPTFDYHPRAIACMDSSGVMPPFFFPVYWQQEWWSP